jgi:hypothetical protein
LWRWTTKTADAATLGDVGINMTAWGTATQLNLSKTTYGGADVTNALLKLKVGDGFYIQDKADASKYGQYTISAAGTDHGSWWSFPVTLDKSGGTPPANNADTNVSLIAQGAQVEEWLGGNGAPAGGLGKIGDWYLDQASGAVYEKTADTTWTQRTNITGPAGATGSQGPAGAPGSQGPAGTPGEKWFTGSGAPSGATGIVGDWYLDSANGDYYEKTGASAWTLRGNLRGPQGATGPQGNPGPSGASTFTSGTGAPSAATGVDGAIYLDTASGRLWGPKASGAWPGTALGRVVPLAPTYAQLKAG